MNIKDHIEAGHYPKDDRGRALVPMRCGEIATIYATDYAGRWPILGTIGRGAPSLWLETGVGAGGMVDDWFLTSPPPRKVKVTRWALMYLPLVRNRCHSTFDTESDAHREVGHFKDGEVVIVPLTGEYEQPWS